MSKRPPKGYGKNPIDVFDDDIGRAADALAAATAPVAPPAEAPTIPTQAAPSPPASATAPQAEPATEPAREKITPLEARGTVVSMPGASERSETAEKARKRPSAPAKKKPTQVAARVEKTPERPTDEPGRVIPKNVGLKFRVPPAVKSEFATFMAELSGALGGVSLDDSNIGRPVLEILLLEHRDRILQAAKEHSGELIRPTNRDLVAMAEFDEALGNIIREGVSTRRRNRGGSGGE